MRVMIYVQHLMGIGHVMRASALASSLDRKGVDVLVVLGGAPVSGAKFGNAQLLYLPPAKAGESSGIVGIDGEVLSHSWYEARKKMLLERAIKFDPHVVVTEQYPFGRRAFRFELDPLLDWAKSKGVRIVSSVRDILVQKKQPEKNLAMMKLALQHFDKIMVHSDPDLISFDETFPHTKEIAHLIHYTGYVQPERSLQADVGDDEVIVSGGSGRYSEALFRTALGARAMSPLCDHRWRILVGHGMSQDVFEDLKSYATNDVVVERVRADFPGILTKARLSISHAGYNTALDILRTNIASVLIPYIAGDDDEQFVRAKLFAEHGAAAYVNPQDMTPATLCEGIATALALPERPANFGRVDGADRSAEFLTNFAQS